VMEHGESTRRQYALVDRAVALGWPRDAIEVIDEDQGQSGASVEGRTGFARLAHAVAHGEVGAVLAVEVSRLSRSSEDWRRLLKLCGLAETVVIDEQTIYDPSDSDDKLLLELKGTMSEVELHWLGLRLTGARRSKARRGALHIHVPTGYIWTERGLRVDPDEAVQRAVRLVLERYDVEPSVWAVIRWARETGLLMPTRHWHADGTTDVTWKPLGVSRLYEMLRNPVYAGVYVYGRRPEKTVLVDGQVRRVRGTGRDPDQWAVRIEGAHEGYITWETYMKHQQKLLANHSHYGGATHGAPRDGVALLTGLVLCGRCGRRMAPAYRAYRSRGFAYVCNGERDRGQLVCWTVPGAPIDCAVESLLLETLVPEELELCLAVEREVDRQAGALEQQWRARLEQAAYEARHAERRYKAVDPDNRVVARTLEREWEQCLRAVSELEQAYEKAKRERRVALSDEDRAKIRALARDLPAVWRAPTTQSADRKAMLRLVIEAIALSPVDVPRRMTHVRVQWRSGAVTELDVPRPDRRTQSCTPPEIQQRIREMVERDMSDEDIAERLNAEGAKTGKSKTWDAWAVRWVRARAKITRSPHDCPTDQQVPDRHPDGRYSVTGTAKRFGVSVQVVRRWVKQGLVHGNIERYGAHPSVWWLRLDRATAAGLARDAKRSRRTGTARDARRRRRAVSPEEHGQSQRRGASIR
jgi:DNA invertase Pin-like site-specific DNA recombinase